MAKLVLFTCFLVALGYSVLCTDSERGDDNLVDIDAPGASPVTSEPEVGTSAPTSGKLFRALMLVLSAGVAQSEASNGSPVGVAGFTCPKQLIDDLPAGQSPCWILAGGTCYCFSLVYDSWKEADKQCRKAGMNLISFDTDEELARILDHIKNINELKHYPYWTGGYYNQSAGEWRWSADEKTVHGQVKKVEDGPQAPEHQCVVINHWDSEGKPKFGSFYIGRFCSSYGYRFICKRAQANIQT